MKKIADRTNWLSEIAFPDTTCILPLPKAIEFILRIRNGVDQFDCTTVQGRFDLYVWWSVLGRHDYPSFQWQLSEADESYLFANEASGLPRAFQMYAAKRPDLQAIIDDPERGADYLIVWWLSEGRSEPFVAYSAAIVSHYLNTRASLSAPLPSIWRLRPDLQSEFDLYVVGGRAAFLEWWKTFGQQEYPSVELCEEQTAAPDYGSDLHKRAPDVAVSVEIEHFKRGVNVIGFAASALGIGEDARMAVAATHRAGIEAATLQPVLLSAPKSSPELEKRGVLHKERYSVSLFCLPPTEMIRLALEGGDGLFASSTYKIGAMPWELPGWPATFNGLVNLVDEIWAQSRFVARSFEPLTALSPVNIHYVPLSVEIPAPTENLRNKYNLPKGVFLFYVMFDGNSWLTRKNPIAGVKAFLKAFNNKNTTVGLVIKAMNIRPNQPMWEDILTIAAQDSRIYIITDTFRRQEVINLMASCDAYISLHRSEGFGRVIAEAMLLGQPTIATNYSGNTDFCTTETSFLVDGDLIPLQQGDYILAEGEHWCDPDIDQGAKRMQEVLEDQVKRKQVALAGRKMIETNFSADAISNVYRERLNSVFEKLVDRHGG